MFVLDEIDRILLQLSKKIPKKKRSTNRLRITLNDLKRVDMHKIHLESINNQIDLSKEMPMLEKFNQKIEKLFEVEESATKKHFSTNLLFISLISPLVLSRLTLIPEYQYPSAKLIICDECSYEMLVRMKYVLTKSKDNNDSIDTQNFIHKSPFNVTAIFLLQDIIDLLNRENEPIILKHSNLASGKDILNFNYPLMRRIFPYIKMSDIFIILESREQLKLDNSRFNCNTILQFFCHFSRSSHLIELNPLIKIMGKVHPIYNNLLAIESTSYLGTNERRLSLNTRFPFRRLDLPHLTSLVERLLQILEKLNLKLCSVSFRAGDLQGQTKIVSQFILSATSASNNNKTSELYASAKLLILDRLYNIQAPFLHADRYGAFLEQEKEITKIRGRNFLPKMESLDKLDELLQLEKLTEVLAIVLKYSSSLKPQEVNLKEERRKGNERLQTNSSFVLAKSQSVRRHLDLVKIVYRCLNEGYLFVLRLESNLGLIDNQLNGLEGPITAAEQIQVADHLKRAIGAYKELVKVFGKSLGPMDVARVACVLLDLINNFIHTLDKIKDTPTETLNLAFKLKTSILNDRDVKDLLKLKEDDATSNANFIEKLYSYDKLSKETCSLRCALPLEKIIEQFYKNQLNQEQFPVTETVNAINQSKGDFVPVLLFLGHMTPNEVCRVKHIERVLKESNPSLNDLVILNCGLLRPSEFLMSL